MARTALAAVPRPGEDKKRAQFRGVSEYRVSTAIICLRAVKRLNDPRKYDHTPEDFNKILEALYREVDEIRDEYAINKVAPPSAPKAKKAQRLVFQL